MEASTAVVDFAFETIRAKGLSAGHHPGNVNSKKVLEKLGFQYTHDELSLAKIQNALEMNNMWRDL